MRKTNLKEMYIVRYVDDFRIFCRTKTVAARTKIAITQWLSERLKLEVSKEKTRVVNVKKCYSEFLGFKIKVHPKGGKKAVKSHISDKQLTAKRKVLVEQVKRIRNPRPEKGQIGEIFLFNKMVLGIQNYYRIATHISEDASKIHRAVMTVITNRLKGISKKGRKLTPAERTRYGKSRMSTKSFRWTKTAGRFIRYRCSRRSATVAAAEIFTRATPALKTSGSGLGNSFPSPTSRRIISPNSRSCSRRTPDNLRFGQSVAQAVPAHYRRALMP